MSVCTHRRPSPGAATHAGKPPACTRGPGISIKQNLTVGAPNAIDHKGLLVDRRTPAVDSQPRNRVSTVSLKMTKKDTTTLSLSHSKGAVQINCPPMQGPGQFQVEGQQRGLAGLRLQGADNTETELALDEADCSLGHRMQNHSSQRSKNNRLTR